jgi:peptidoglycan/LPS O-acetylase OafA/YrhL
VPEQRSERPERVTAPSFVGRVVAPTPPTPHIRGERYRELDGYRGIAVLAISLFHVFQFCNVDHYLYFGTPGYTLLNSLDAMVPFFFVLTAFLLFEPIARSAIEGGRPISGRGFLVRRAVRILPVYYVAVVVVWFTRQPSLPGDWRDLLEHLTFTQVFDSKRIFYTNGPAWSLSVEVFFYLGLVVLSIGLARTCRHLATRKHRIAVIGMSIVALACISISWKTWAFGIGHESTTGSFSTWFGPLANLDNFAVGMALAVVVGTLGDIRPLTARSRVALRLGALAILVFAFTTRQANAWTGVYFSTFCAVGFGALIAAAVLGPPGDRWSRALSPRPLLWLGTISYSIYLWNEPVLLGLNGWHGLVRQSPGAFVVDALVVLVFSVIVGLISFVLIERPTSQLGRVFRRDGRLQLPSGESHGDRREWETFASGNPF